MADELKVEITGLEELHRDFQSLARKIQPKELQPILKKEAAVFARKLLAVTPRRKTGNLQKGVKAWSPKINARHPEAMARVGVKYQIAPHVHLVEYGTVARYTDAGARRGIMPAHPFIMPLANAQMPGMLRRLMASIRDVIYKEWR